MAKTIPIRPVAWSHSAINSFLTCGKQYHEVKVLKKYSDDNENNRWGNRVHEYFEQSLERRNRQSTDDHSDGRTNDPAMAIYDGVIERLARIEGQLSAEHKLAITNAFRPTTWFAPDVWCRGIADALWLNGATAKIIDFKTGKRKPDTKQLILLALLVFAHHPEVDRINAAFVWLQTGKMDVEKYKREDITVLWQELLPDVRRFELAHKNQTWTPKPSGLCRGGWCPVVDCHFNEKFKEHGVVLNET